MSLSAIEFITITIRFFNKILQLLTRRDKKEICYSRIMLKKRYFDIFLYKIIRKYSHFFANVFRRRATRGTRAGPTRSRRVQINNECVRARGCVCATTPP